MIDDATKYELWKRFHTLWGQAVCGATYKKDDWIALQLILEKICNI